MPLLVKHLPQYEESKTKETYVLSFGVEYLFSGGHNNAPRESIANEGTYNYIKFKNFIDKTVGPDELYNLLNNNNLTDQGKMDKLDIWNQVYLEELNKKVSSLLPKEGELENQTMDKNNKESNVSESTNPNR
ncbi:MAG: hypothetical protein IPO83_16610 [Chitinophagaceae bacterium]|nr:hypothetical protein [Chitinophagaceae bacterium]